MKTHFSKGFTLIEAIIYLALFSIIIGGGMVSAYQIIQSADSARNYIALQQEANFLIGKMHWALTDATNICFPISSNATQLIITKNSSANCQIIADTLTFDIDNNNLQLARGVEPATTLNSSSVKVLDMLFSPTTAIVGQPKGITTSFTLETRLNGRVTQQHFSFTQYLRTSL